MSPLTPRLYVAQRISAVFMAPLVIGHLAVIIFAIQGGLDSAEILSRTRGSLLWGLFYETFVVAVSIHAAIGVRVVAFEWLHITNANRLAMMTWSVGLLLFAMGSYAVFAVIAP